MTRMLLTATAFLALLAAPLAHAAEECAECSATLLGGGQSCSSSLSVTNCVDTEQSVASVDAPCAFDAETEITASAEVEEENNNGDIESYTINDFTQGAEITRANGSGFVEIANGALGAAQDKVDAGQTKKITFCITVTFVCSDGCRYETGIKVTISQMGVVVSCC